MISSFTRDAVATNLPWPVPVSSDPISHVVGNNQSPGGEAYESTSHSSYVNHKREPQRYDAHQEYTHNKAKAHMPAEWATSGDRTFYASSYKSNYNGNSPTNRTTNGLPNKIPPIPREGNSKYIGNHHHHHQEPYDEQFSTPTGLDPLNSLLSHYNHNHDHDPTMTVKREVSAVIPLAYNILNGSEMPNYTRARQPGTFFAGRVSAAKLEARSNARGPGYDIISHETHQERDCPGYHA